MTITIGGLASGIDTDALVSSLVAAASIPGAELDEQLETLESRESAYGALSARLTTLQAALEAMDEATEFRGVTASSADSDTVDVSATGDAIVGTFSVLVNQLAAATLDVSDGFADRESTGVIAEGTLSITVGGTTTSVTIDGTNSSLDDLVAAINDQVSGVTAYVMDTGDASTPYRLVIAGESTGLDNAVTVDTSGLTGPGTVPTFTETIAAADAEVEVNGITITDSDNDIDGAIQGVTFHAYATSTSAVSITVAEDTDAMVEAVETLVTAWNAVVSQVAAQRVWNVDEGMRGSFIGESVPRSVLQRLQSTVAATYGSGSVITALSQMGVSTTQDGLLEIDDDVLAAALADNFDDVVALFTDETDGLNVALQSAIDTFIDEDDGTITARLDTLADEIETMGERIDAFDERMVAYEERLEAQFTQMEIIMARLDQSLSILLALMPSSSSDDS